MEKDISLKNKGFSRLLLISLFLVFIDQVSKASIRSNLEPGESVSIIDNFLRITFTPNYKGFSWWVPEMPFVVHFIYDILIILIVLLAFPVFIFFSSTRHRSIWASIAVVGIFSGCYGNFLDKFFTPYTTDFIHLFNIRPKPNLADIYGTIGLIGLAVEMIIYYRVKRFSWKGTKHFLTARRNTFREFLSFLKKDF